ncbi:MAG TPA: type II toxin-antitoxin system RelE/ParE family toxin [Xanthobacteraceae bacterium]|nr:type II toxin-antitoxin system RelE/ParE family toxin [Xanthobacteraceae bacterium]
MHSVVETPAYLADAERLFTTEERTAIVDHVAADPECGVLIPGTGGIRKVRFGFGGRGKRGGARVIYYLAGDEVPIFLLTVFAKNEKADLTPRERAGLASSVKEMTIGYRRRP